MKPFETTFFRTPHQSLQYFFSTDIGNDHIFIHLCQYKTKWAIDGGYLKLKFDPHQPGYFLGNIKSGQVSQGEQRMWVEARNKGKKMDAAKISLRQYLKYYWKVKVT